MNSKFLRGSTSTRINRLLVTASFIAITSLATLQCAAQEPPANVLDEQVQAYLDSHKHDWYDLNVPVSDGQRLYDLVVENGYTRAVEVGTSTGHSAIWIAWALSKTGGRLITIEIDEGRYEEAKKNFEEAGVGAYIDARLADAHELVPKLDGPFDFVFLDADKDWYTRYFKMLLPKLTEGACIAAHNVTGARSGWQKEYLDALKATPGMRTEVIRSSRSRGLSVSFYTAVE